MTVPDFITQARARLDKHKPGDQWYNVNKFLIGTVPDLTTALSALEVAWEALEHVVHTAPRDKDGNIDYINDWPAAQCEKAQAEINRLLNEEGK